MVMLTPFFPSDPNYCSTHHSCPPDELQHHASHARTAPCFDPANAQHLTNAHSDLAASTLVHTKIRRVRLDAVRELYSLGVRSGV
jgi:hypothetical protein